MKRFLVTPLHNWTIAYVVAFSAVGFILITSLILNQMALYRTTISRGAAALEARQSVRSEQIVYDAIWLSAPGNHAFYLKQIQADVNAMEVDRLLLNKSYIQYYAASFTRIDGDIRKAVKVYYTVRSTALDLIATENRLTGERLQKADKAQAIKDIKTLFIVQPEQLSNIQAAQAIIDADTDSYIARIRAIDIASSILGALVLLFEGIFVVYPATRRLQHP